LSLNITAQNIHFDIASYPVIWDSTEVYHYDFALNTYNSKICTPVHLEFLDGKKRAICVRLLENEIYDPKKKKKIPTTSLRNIKFSNPDWFLLNGIKGTRGLFKTKMAMVAREHYSLENITIYEAPYYYYKDRTELRQRWIIKDKKHEIRLLKKTHKGELRKTTIANYIQESNYQEYFSEKELKRAGIKYLLEKIQLLYAKDSKMNLWIDEFGEIYSKLQNYKYQLKIKSIDAQEVKLVFLDKKGVVKKEQTKIFQLNNTQTNYLKKRNKYQKIQFLPTMRKPSNSLLDWYLVYPIPEDLKQQKIYTSQKKHTINSLYDFDNKKTTLTLGQSQDSILWEGLYRDPNYIYDGKILKTRYPVESEFYTGEDQNFIPFFKKTVRKKLEKKYKEFCYTYFKGRRVKFGDTKDRAIVLLEIQLNNQARISDYQILYTNNKALEKLVKSFAKKLPKLDQNIFANSAFQSPKDLYPMRFVVPFVYQQGMLNGSINKLRDAWWIFGK
jgi:hypothetical protein